MKPEDPLLAEIARFLGSIGHEALPVSGPAEGQQVRALLVAARNAAEARQHAEERLRETESRLEAVLAEQQRTTTAFQVLAERTAARERTLQIVLTSARDFSYLFDRNGRFLFANQPLLDLWGLRLEDVVGKSFLELGYPAELAAKLERQINSVFEARKSIRDETPYTSPSGVDGVYEYILSPVVGAEGGVDFVVGSTRDITESKQLGTQLLQAQKMEAVGRLAGGVAHDFNNALGVILGYTELLIRQASDMQRGRLEQIQKATQRAASLTHQLLAFSRQQIVAPRVLDVNVLLMGLEEMLKRLIGEDIELRIVTDPDAGQVRADPGQLEQVVVNLCVNARDAMPHGGLLRIATANVELAAGRGDSDEPMAPGRYVVITVSDAGAGIPKESLKKIFEPFYTTKEHGKGTGLGLAMVYGIVRQAGGYIDVVSELWQGSTFTVSLPRIDERAAPLDALPAKDLPERGSETILLVEDEPALRAIVREMLEEHGYRVIEAGSGQEALEQEAMFTGPIHLLLTDVVMPGMNGLGLAGILVGHRPGLPVLYMSGYTDDVLAHRGVLSPGTALIEKPFTAATLLRSVHQALTHRP